jgi:hypothetical protein
LDVRRESPVIDPKPESVPGWTHERRSDGLRILFIPHAAERKFVITEADGTAVEMICPCCSKPFQTLRGAQLVANFLRPLPREPS